MRIICFLFIAFSSLQVFSYELIFIQGISESKKTFVTRKGTRDGITVGKKSTFTANNISVIATAIKVTGEYTQWKIENQNTKIPFKRDEIVTMYDATEYLWTLNPESVKSRYIKSEIYEPRYAVETHLSFSRGLSESVSNADSTVTERGGYQFEGYIQKEFNRNYAIALGLRYTKEIVNIETASYNQQRFLGMVEGRYYFDQLKDFYNSRISLAFGLGLGQSYTETIGQASSGTSAVLPSVKMNFNFPISKNYDMTFYGAVESVQTRETLADATKQTTNLVNSKAGVAFRLYL